MKITPVRQMGSFGVYVDDIDMNYMTEPEWHELGQLFVRELIVICRNIKISKTQFLDWIPKFGPLKTNLRAHFYKKYGTAFDAMTSSTWGNLDDDDRKWAESRSHQLEPSGDGRYLTRIYGQRDEHGNMLGYFSHGEVHWHCDESSSLLFTPAVALMGNAHMVGSATGFVQTIDLYETLTESFRSELNEMILIHRYNPGQVNSEENTDSMLALHLKLGFCPEDNEETPLICVAPNGRTGLHYPINTRYKIKNMSDREAQQVFNQLDHLILNKKWIFDHHYQTDNDLVLFENSVTLHHRIGGHPERKAFRMQFDLSSVLESPWRPWQHNLEFDQQYKVKIHEFVNLVGGDIKERFKLP